jgi:hypothetical protein
MHAYEVRPRKDKRGFDLISDALWYAKPNAVANARKKVICRLMCLAGFDL